MQYIPQYKPQPFIQRRQGFQGEQALQALSGYKQRMEESNRLKNKAIQSAMDQMSPSELVGQQNSELAEEAYQDIIGNLTNAMMYQMDDDGSFTEKRKEHAYFGPQISDKEYGMIMEKVRNADQLITELRAEEKEVKKQSDILEGQLLSSPGKFNKEKSLAVFDEYYTEGKMPEDGQWMVYNGVGADVWTKNSKYYTKDQDKSVVGDYNVVPGAKEDYQRGIYKVEMQDPAKQKGMVDDMVKNIDGNTELGRAAMERIAGELADEGVSKDEMFARYQKELDDFRVSGKPSQALVEAGKMWGEEDAKYYKNIAAGYSTRRGKGGGSGEDISLVDGVWDMRTSPIGFKGSVAYYEGGEKKKDPLTGAYITQIKHGRIPGTKETGLYASMIVPAAGSSAFDAEGNVDIASLLLSGKQPPREIYVKYEDIKGSLGKYNFKDIDKYIKKPETYVLEGHGTVTEQDLRDAGWSTFQIKALKKQQNGR